MLAKHENGVKKVAKTEVLNCKLKLQEFVFPLTLVRTR